MSRVANQYNPVYDFKIENFNDYLFLPSKHVHWDLPDKPGNYIICLNKGVELPHYGFDVKYSTLQDKKVLYTGIGESLRNRDYKQHFSGNAGSSTLRLSIGVLLGYERIYRDKNKIKRKFKFHANHENELSIWMKENLVMYYLTGDNCSEIEKFLIKTLNPPLNLRGNTNRDNFDFRKKLTSLRTSKIEEEEHSQNRTVEQVDAAKPNISFKSILKVIAFLYVLFRLIDFLISR